MSSLRDELQSIYEDTGRLTPTLVVAYARDEDHPLHDRFTWDDTVAGEKWRKEEARMMIRRVKIVMRPATQRKPEVLGRVWHAFPPEPTDEGPAGEYDYFPTDEIAADPIRTAILLAAMEREWKQLKARYGHFAEFAAMIQGDLAA
jgi:hypothetical protein